MSNKRFLDIATEMECALDAIGHIETPCFFPEGSNEYFGLRESYMIWAEETVLPKLENPYAKKLLSETIRKYRK